ncbi:MULTISPECIES: helix-turn-helix domain-containing protein [Sphingobacterium]|uniref:helix-turn-helix domain-containing protein n=1 Tax=Sphingobacterium TaxID=28453 RepID=UPI00257F1364|nr:MULTISPECIES: helix-turn-helix domain-containing protein [Sphingobacterium]
MKKNTFFKLSQRFQKVDEIPMDFTPHLKLAAAPPIAYGSNIGHVLHQQFDGLVGFINCLDFDLKATERIPIEIKGNDLHMLYLPEGEQGIILSDKKTHVSQAIAPQRGRFFYLPEGEYELWVPPGCHFIFNFYFRGSIFRDGNEKPFPYLYDLIDDFRNGSDQSSSSIDFKVGKRTSLLIKTILSNLKKGDLESEDNILWGIKKLIKLSKEKVFEEYHKISEAQLKAKEAHDHMRHFVSLHGHDFKVDAIAELLGISMDYLHRLIHSYYGQSPKGMKITFVLDLAQKYVLDGMPTDQIAYELGYASPSSFARFFKNKTGMTTTEFFERNNL